MDSATHSYRLGLLAATGTGVLLVLSSGALGIIGSGEHDRIYLGVLAVAVAGAVLGRLRPRGMVWALLAALVAQLLTVVVALAAGWHEGASVVDIVGINAMFASLWALGAWLFHRAYDAGRRARVP